jgi:hypothetical protein
VQRCAVLSGTALAAVVAAPVLINYRHAVAAVALFVVGALVLLGSVFYALRRLACPRCKTPWLQYALGEKSMNGWLAWLTEFTECPACGLSAARHSEENANGPPH